MHRSRLAFAVLLLMVIVFANAARADENSLFLQITNPAPAMTPSTAAPDCKADLSPLDNAVSATQFCGSCSPDAFCRGLQLYSPCGGGRACKNLYSTYCSIEPVVQWECYCTNKVLE